MQQKSVQCGLVLEEVDSRRCSRSCQYLLGCAWRPGSNPPVGVVVGNSVGPVRGLPHVWEELWGGAGAACAHGWAWKSGFAT